MTHPTCATCRFWDRNNTFNTIGQCRRRAPSQAWSGDAYVWPDTQDEDWCGEHDPKPEGEE